MHDFDSKAVYIHEVTFQRSAQTWNNFSLSSKHFSLVGDSESIVQSIGEAEQDAV
jgi:hypothetical protein